MSRRRWTRRFHRFQKQRHKNRHRGTPARKPHGIQCERTVRIHSPAIVRAAPPAVQGLFISFEKIIYHTHETRPTNRESVMIIRSACVFCAEAALRQASQSSEEKSNIFVRRKMPLFRTYRPQGVRIFRVHKHAYASGHQLSRAGPAWQSPGARAIRYFERMEKAR